MKILRWTRHTDSIVFSELNQRDINMADVSKIIDTDGGAYVEGQVTVEGGDFVGRDKITSIDQGASIEDFVKLLAEIRQSLPQAAIDPEVRRVIESDFQIVEVEAAKDKPNSAIVKGKLKGMLEMLSTAGGALDGAEVVALLTRASKWAAALFL